MKSNNSSKHRYTVCHLNRTQKALLMGWLLMLFAVLPPTYAATDSQNNVQVYQATFFAQYSPRNALDMVKQLPGFTFDPGDSKRGFGNNAGNVLIDDVRPATKSGGIESALIRIPAAQVERIELTKGNAAEAEGHILVANVIKLKSKVSGSWTARGRHVSDYGFEPNVEAVLQTPIGQWDTAFDIDLGVLPNSQRSKIREFNADNEDLASADEVMTYARRFGFLNSEATTNFKGGKLRLNGRLAKENTQYVYDRQIYADDLTPELERDLDVVSQYQLGEFGVDWAKTEDDWKLRLLTLGTLKDSSYQFGYVWIRPQEPNAFYNYESNKQKTEWIARSTYNKVGDHQLKPEYGIELTKNRLDTEARAGTPGELQPSPGADVLVQEWRGEAFAGLVYKPDSRWTIEGKLTLETSQIKVTGDADNQQSLKFIKPRLSANYQFDQDTRLTFEAFRTVGQLSFDNFADNAVANQQRTNTGNPHLTPTHWDDLLTTFNWRFHKRGSLTLKAYYRWRSNVLEQTIISTNDEGEIEQGLGNVGDGTVWGLTGYLRFPVDTFLTNGSFNVYYNFRRSDYFDPITQANRRLNYDTPEKLNLSFRQDVVEHQFAWGVEYFRHHNQDLFLVDELQTTDTDRNWHVFVETSRFFGLKLQLNLYNMDNSYSKWTRRHYDQTRAGSLLKTEVYNNKSPLNVSLTVYGEF